MMEFYVGIRTKMSGIIIIIILLIIIIIIILLLLIIIIIIITIRKLFIVFIKLLYFDGKKRLQNQLHM